MKLFNKVICLLAVLVLPVTSVLANTFPVAQRIAVVTGLPQLYFLPVLPGQTAATIEIPIGATHRFSMDVIAPVPTPTLTLLTPDGQTTPGVTFFSGAEVSPPLPGGMFHVGDVMNPMHGTWKLALSFPPAPQKTLIQVELHLVTPYRVGMTLTQDTYLLGETASAGVLVLNGTEPVLGLSPQLTVTHPNGLTTTLLLQDSGHPANLDGKYGDGVYSDRLFLSERGKWMLSSNVKIPTPEGEIERTAIAFINVVEPAIRLENVQASLTNGKGGKCITGINVRLDSTVLKTGNFTGRASLSALNGKTITRSLPIEAKQTGALAFDVFFPSEELLEEIGASDGPYTIAIADLLNHTDSGNALDARQRDAGNTPVFTQEQLCVKPLKIGPDSTTTITEWDNDYITRVVVSFPIAVATAGTYSLSYKVTDKKRRDVQMFARTLTLSQGINEISTEVVAAYMREFDGPFNIESVMLQGQGLYEYASLLKGTGEPFSTWQMSPSMAGPYDINLDEKITSDDLNLLMTFRNQTALTPRDRRDLNRDGKIDGLDFLLWQKKR